MQPVVLPAQLLGLAVHPHEVGWGEAIGTPTQVTSLHATVGGHAIMQVAKEVVDSPCHPLVPTATALAGPCANPHIVVTMGGL